MFSKFVTNVNVSDIENIESRKDSESSVHGMSKVKSQTGHRSRKDRIKVILV